MARLSYVCKIYLQKSWYVFNTSLNLPMVSCVLAHTKGKSSHVHNDCWKTAHVVEKLVSAGITLVPLILTMALLNTGPLVFLIVQQINPMFLGGKLYQQVSRIRSCNILKKSIVPQFESFPAILQVTGCFFPYGVVWSAYVHELEFSSCSSKEGSFLESKIALLRLGFESALIGSARQHSAEFQARGILGNLCY